MKNNIFNGIIGKLFGKTLAIAFLLGILSIASLAQTPTFTGKLVNQAGSPFATVEVFGTDVSTYWSRVWMSTNKIRTVFPSKSSKDGYYYSRYIEYSYYGGEPLNTKFWAELGGGWVAINTVGEGYMMADYQVVGYTRVAVKDTWYYFRLTQ